MGQRWFGERGREEGSAVAAAGDGGGSHTLSLSPLSLLIT